MQWRSLLLEFNLDNLFCIVPSATCIGHEDSLIKSKDSDREQVAHEEEGFDKGKS